MDWITDLPYDVRGDVISDVIPTKPRSSGYDEDGASTVDACTGSRK